MEKKSGLPSTHEISLDTNTLHWGALSKKTTDKVSTKAKIKLDRGTFAFNIELRAAFSPENQRVEVRSTCQTNFGDPAFDSGLARISTYFKKSIEETAWMLVGVTVGAKPRPIIITHYEKLDITIYTFKVSEKEVKNLLPGGHDFKFSEN